MFYCTPAQVERWLHTTRQRCHKYCSVPRRTIHGHLSGDSSDRARLRHPQGCRWLTTVSQCPCPSTAMSVLIHPCSRLQRVIDIKRNKNDRHLYTHNRPGVECGVAIKELRVSTYRYSLALSRSIALWRTLLPYATHTIVEHCVKNQLIRLRTLGEEALVRPYSHRKSAIFTRSAVATLCFEACSIF